jgi:phage gp45-like
MKDFLGNDLKIGDDVVFVQLGYRNLLKGKIAKITEKTILIHHDKTNTCSTKTKQFPEQVIKINL